MSIASLGVTCQGGPPAPQVGNNENWQEEMAMTMRLSNVISTVKEGSI